jgi:hypothetical protein
MSEPLETKRVMEGLIRGTLSRQQLNLAVTIATSFFALCAALSGLMATRSSGRALLHKNDAILAQAELTNQWNFYQSRNIRAEIGALASQFPKKPATLKELASRVGELREERDRIYVDARELERKRDAENTLSSGFAIAFRGFSSALILLQVALVLIPMTMFVERRTPLFVGTALGASGIAIFVEALAQYLALAA